MANHGRRRGAEAARGRQVTRSRKLSEGSATIPALLLGCILSACQGGSPGTVRTVHRDSAGVALAESASLPQEGAEGWSLGQAPEVTVGTLEGDTLYQLFQVSSGVIMEDGRIVIADNGAMQLRIYDPDGTFLRSMGREGEGPGEFRFMQIMGTLGPDTVVVLDGSQRRVSFFHTQAGFLFQANVQEDAGMTYFANGMFGDGSVVFGGGLRAGPGFEIPDDGYKRDPTTYQSVNREGKIVTEFGEFPGPEIYFQAQGGGGERMISATVLHFGKRPQAIARENELVVGSGDTYELEVYDPEGRHTRTIRVRTPSIPVTEDHLDALLQESLSALPDPSMEARVRSSFTDVPHAEFLPAIGRLLLDPEGYLWVEDYHLPNGPLRTWTLFDPQGNPVTRLSHPAKYRILDVGTRKVLTLFEDDLGVEYLGILPLTRGAG